MKKTTLGIFIAGLAIITASVVIAQGPINTQQGQAIDNSPVFARVIAPSSSSVKKLGYKLVCEREKDKEIRKGIRVDDYSAQYIARQESLMRPPFMKRIYVCVESDLPVVFDFMLPGVEINEEDSQSSIFDSMLSTFKFID